MHEYAIGMHTSEEVVFNAGMGRGRLKELGSAAAAGDGPCKGNRQLALPGPRRSAPLRDPQPAPR